MKAGFGEAIQFDRGDHPIPCRKAMAKSDGDAPGCVPPEMSWTADPKLPRSSGIAAKPRLPKSEAGAHNSPGQSRLN